MDITNIPQNLIKVLEQKNTEQLAALSSVLNLVIGKIVIASVVSTTPVTADEREELLKQTAAALTQLNQQSVGKLTPNIKAELTRLMQQQNLIQSPALKWINLVVNDRQLLTYSDRPLTLGQTIPVQLQSPQKLVLLDLPELAPNNPVPGKIQTVVPAVTVSTISKLTDPIANNSSTTSLTETKSALAVNELLKSVISKSSIPELANKIVTSPTNITQNIETAASSVSTKNILTPDTSTNKSAQEKTTTPGITSAVTDAPHKPGLQNKINLYSANDLLIKTLAPSANKNNSTDTITAKHIVSEHMRNVLPHKDNPDILLPAVLQLQNFPTAQKSKLFSPNVEQALKSLAEKIRSPEQIAQPKVLVQTLKNSGTFFESKINQLAPNENNVSTSTKHALNNIYSQDLKGSLLTLLSRVTQELSGSNKPITSEQVLNLFKNLGNGATFKPTPDAVTSTTNKIDITQNLGLLIQELMHKPVKELSNNELRTQLLVLLQQHSLHSLAKIQLQQLHNINQDLETKDVASPGASWQLEIPIKHHNDVQHLHMRIDREWIEEKNETEPQKGTNKIKQWSVTLRFDLPTLGEFCAQLAIMNTQISATLWAAREKTFTEVREHIEGLRKQLESEGINVKYLHCVRGMPPQKPMALSYSLIDVST